MRFCGDGGKTARETLYLADGSRSFPKMSPRAKVLPLHRKGELGSQGILERLFEEHAGALRSFLGVRLGSGQDVEDVVQDVYVRLARQDGLLEKVAASSGSTRSYLYTIANNLVVDRQRHSVMARKHGLTEVTELPERAVHQTPERAIVADQELERVKAVLMKLAPMRRQAFVLSRFRHMSYRQIAIEMDIKPKRVEKYIASVLAVLRQVR